MSLPMSNGTAPVETIAAAPPLLPPDVLEWSYGFSSDGGSGVAWNMPRDHHQHRFRQGLCDPIPGNAFATTMLMDFVFCNSLYLLQPTMPP